MNKCKVTSSLRGISYGLYFLALFFFSLLLSVGKKSVETAVTPAPLPLQPRFLRALIGSKKGSI